MPNIQYNIPLPNAQGLTILGMPTISTALETLVYSKEGGTIFPYLQKDLVAEVGIYHGGNPLIEGEYSIKSCSNVDVNVFKEEIISREISKGIFDIEYNSAGGTNSNGKVEYFWSDTYCTPLGIYTVADNVANWDFEVSDEIIRIETNDVNSIPMEGDYVIFNAVTDGYTGYTNGDPSSRLKLFKGKALFQAKILEVIILGGNGVDTQFQLRLDKSFDADNAEKFAIVLLNRDNTDIQKELFYDTFEQIEVHRKQLIGDPYNNVNNINKPKGRKNHLYYGGHESLGYNNLLKPIINNSDTPIVIFDINDEVKDRFSFYPNTYDSDNKPLDVNFEMHLPGVLINGNTFTTSSGSTSPVDANGNVLENIFITTEDYENDTSGVGKYAGLYLKTDTNKTRRYGFVFYDLRIVVIDHPELATVLGYNSNRNYTLPTPTFKIGAANALPNLGIGVNINIVNATNTSPIVIETDTPHRLQRGTKVVISGVTGNTSANGEWYVDNLYPTSDPYRFEIWAQLPQYNPDGTRVIPLTGTATVGNGIFINNGVGNSGIIVGALPAYSYFYTYRIRDKYNRQVMPYAELINFNFTTNNIIDNNAGSLFVNLPKLNWDRGSNNLTSYDLGIDTLSVGSDSSYGVDIIIGQYDRDNSDPLNPTKIKGIKNVMCIPIAELNEPFIGTPVTGFNIEVKKIQDYDRVVLDTNNLVQNYKFDLYNNLKLYNYSVNTLSETLLVGGGMWNIGEIIYRSHVDVSRLTIDISVPANKWNDSTNPSFRPSQNEFIRDKYISEVGVYLEDQDKSAKPMIYAKIAPAIRKSNDVDINITLSIDY